MRMIDCHVHCGTAESYAGQAYEDVAPYLNDAKVDSAVCFSPVAEVYDRGQVDFDDNEDWQERRAESRNYLLQLKDRKHTIFPFHFVWNDFDVSDLDRVCGIKWHRHKGEPHYNYDDPKCTQMIAAIRERNLPIILEEEYDNTMLMVDVLAREIPIIIPYIGEFNGSATRLLEEDLWSRPNTYADMSSATTSEFFIRKFVDKYGPERLLFGSDYPFGTPLNAKEKVLALGLATDDERLIFSENILRLMQNTDLYEK